MLIIKIVKRFCIITGTLVPSIFLLWDVEDPLLQHEYIFGIGIVSFCLWVIFETITTIKENKEKKLSNKRFESLGEQYKEVMNQNLSLKDQYDTLIENTDKLGKERNLAKKEAYAMAEEAKSNIKIEDRSSLDKKRVSVFLKEANELRENYSNRWLPSFTRMLTIESILESVGVVEISKTPNFDIKNFFEIKVPGGSKASSGGVLTAIFKNGSSITLRFMSGRISNERLEQEFNFQLHSKWNDTNRTEGFMLFWRIMSNATHIWSRPDAFSSDGTLIKTKIDDTDDKPHENEQFLEIIDIGIKSAIQHALAK